MGVAQLLAPHVYVNVWSFDSHLSDGLEVVRQDASMRFECAPAGSRMRIRTETWVDRVLSSKAARLSTATNTGM